MSETVHLRSFEDLRPDEARLVGGKAATLARLYQAGHLVPDGIIILPSAFDGDDLAAPSWAKVDEYLGRRWRDEPKAAFSVRSSALTEDSATASFAGQFETVLNVSSRDAIRQAIRRVRGSRRSERVQAYGRVKGVDPDHVMAVIVQRMVPAEISGVLFTADPVTGSREVITGSSVRGFGDRLVSGEVTGDAFRIDRRRGTYSGSQDLLAYAPELRRLADRLESELEQPQDVEWAIANGELFLLQSRPITTLVADEPPAEEWNDSLTGDFLWSNVNFGEAVSTVMTPLTWSVIRLALEDWVFLPGHESTGNIGGRPYLNLSVFASVFHAMGKSPRDLLDTLEPTVFTPLPEGMEVPLIPLSKVAVLRHLPRWVRIEMRQRNGIRALPSYVRSNAAWCRQMMAQIRDAETGVELLSLWRRGILPHLRQGVWVVLGSASFFARVAAPLRRALGGLVGPEDADSLLLGPHGAGSEVPANLGPLVGIAKLARGEMDREDYLERFGHRGPHEFELSIRRPIEDPRWLDRQIEIFRHSPVDVTAMLWRSRTRFDAAWGRFRSRFPRRAGFVRRRVARASRCSRRREAARSEYVRDRWVVREFVLRAGELTGVRGDVFFLTIEEVLDALSGDSSKFASIPGRKQTHRRYGSLPPYPSVIRGRFDPFRWAADPSRRTDVFDSLSVGPPDHANGAEPRAVHGAAGSAGSVEGVVRRLNSPAEGGGLRVGEVLVTIQTDIEWTPLFPMAAAVVTDVGAPFSHAAIVARELGIPAVVGCGDATMRLRTGDRVTVDGGRGVVRIVG